MSAETVGCRYRVTVQNEVYEGTLKSIDPATEKLSLEKVTVVSKNKKLKGLLSFYGDEISEVEILDEHRNVKLDKDDKGPTLLGKKMSVPHLDNMNNLEPKKLVLSRGYYSCGEEEEKKRPDPVRLQRIQFSKDVVAKKSSMSDRPDCYAVIDQIDQQYKDAVNYLETQSILGVCLEGIKLGRNGKLCWVQVASKDFVFLFDILALGYDCFTCGFGEILKSSSILKIFHDCRLASDILFHQYGIKLINIFDTQVADVLIFRLKHCGDLPRYLNGLACCLFQHLDIRPDNVHVQRVRKECMEEDQSVWAVRPLPQYLLIAAFKHAVYLRELRQVLVEKLMTEFICGVDIYLELIRDADVNSEEFKMALENSHLLPASFKSLPEMASCRTDFLRGRNHSRRQERGPNGFRENCQGVIDPFVIYSHDSIWHSGKKLPNENFSDIDKSKGMSSSTSASDVLASIRTAGFSSFGCGDRRRPVQSTPSSTATPKNAKPSPYHQLGDDSLPDEEDQAPARDYTSFANHELLVDNMGNLNCSPSNSAVPSQANEGTLGSFSLTHFENDCGVVDEQFSPRIDTEENQTPREPTLHPLQEIPGPSSSVVLKPAGSLQTWSTRKQKGPSLSNDAKSLTNTGNRSPQFIIPQLDLSRTPITNRTPSTNNVEVESVSRATTPVTHRMQGVLNGGVRHPLNTPTAPGMQRRKPSPRQLVLNAMGRSNTSPAALSQISESPGSTIVHSSLVSSPVNEEDFDAIPGPSLRFTNTSSDSDQGFNSETDNTPVIRSGRGRSTLCRFTI